MFTVSTGTEFIGTRHHLSDGEPISWEIVLCFIEIRIPKIFLINEHSSNAFLYR